MDDAASDQPIHLDDLAEPRFSPEVADIFAAMADLAADCPLDTDELHRRAAAETGLSDFGPDDYRERLDVLLGALREVRGLTGAGVVTYHTQVLQLLKNRLLLVDRLARHPEILEAELVPPIIVAGLPRTGTTHLHNLLGADPALRILPYWESLEPFALAAEAGIEPDPRRVRTDVALDFMAQAMPHFTLMHEMTTDHAHEEIALLAVDFSTMFFETMADVPAWRAYYQAHDQTPHYRFLRTLLLAIQHERPTRAGGARGVEGGSTRWLLKSPQHLEQFGVLAEVFGDATVVVTHRDPAAVTVSMATMIAYAARMHAWPVDPRRVGQVWADRIEVMLDACVRDRHRLAAERSIDVRFDEFMADDLAMARRIYELADQPVTTEAEGAWATYLDGHARGRLGRIDYPAEDVGLDLDDLSTRFTAYRQRFGV